MSIDQALLAMLDSIYAAASDHTLWESVIRKLMDTVESQAASFCVIDASDQPKMPIFSYINVESRSLDRVRFLREYLEEGVAEQDPTVQYIIAHPGQKLVRDSAFISEAEKDRHFYYDWHGKFSDTRHRMAGMVNPAPQIQSGVTLHRTRQMGDFQDSQIERFNFLLPHIERAVRLGFQLGTLGAFQRATVELLDSSGRAVIFLDREGRVLFANRAASAIATAADGIVLSQAGLSLQRPSDNRRFQQLLCEALTIPDRVQSSGAMLVARPSGKRAFSMLISPLSGNSELMAGAKPAVCVSITDPECHDLLPVSLLKNLFGLTPAEAKLAARLARGEALAAAAAELDISYATARTQLAVIFRKTDTSRQGELVRLLLINMPSLQRER